MTELSSELIIDTCPHCLSDFTDKSEFERHAEKCKRYHDHMNGSSTSVCGLCPYSSNDEGLMEHMVNHHGQVLTADTFVDEHVAQCIKDSTCVVCGAVCNSTKEVVEHVQEKHDAVLAKLKRKSMAAPAAVVEDKSVSPAKWKCPKCSRSVPTRSQRSHLALCKMYYDKVVDDTTCGICHMTFESNQILYSHFAEEHQKVKEEVVREVVAKKQLVQTEKCRYCDKELTRKSSLVLHERSCKRQRNKENRNENEAFDDETKTNSVGDSFDHTPEVDDPKDPLDNAGLALVTISDERSLSSSPKLNNISASSTIGPELVTKVFACPVCAGKLMTFRDAQDHLVKFHQVSLLYQNMLAAKGVAIKEVKL